MVVMGCPWSWGVRWLVIPANAVSYWHPAVVEVELRKTVSWCTFLFKLEVGGGGLVCDSLFLF